MTSGDQKNGLTYRAAGVDIAAGDAFGGGHCASRSRTGDGAGGRDGRGWAALGRCST